MPISLTRARLRSARPSYRGTAQSVPGGSLINPDSWESARRMVTASIDPSVPVPPRSSGRWTAIGSSRSNRPASRSCTIAAAVNVFVIDAIR